MTAQQLKASILQLAIQGKLVPQNSEDEPASMLLKRIKAEKDALVKAGKIKRDKHESVIIRNEDGRYLEKKDGKTTDITDEIPFDIPESWEWVRLGTICQVKGGKRIPLGDKMLDTPTAHIYLRVTDMKDGTIIDAPKKYISEETYQKISKYTISSDDLYLTIAGTIGLVGIIPDEFDGMNLTENAAKLTNIYANRLFLAKLLNAPYFQGIFLYKKTQVAQPKLALERIASVLFPLPPLEEQKRIVAKIEELLPHVEEYGKAETELSKLNAELPEQLKKSILQWAIQGRLVPQDPNDEPASELLKRIKAEKNALVKSGKLKPDKHESVIIRDEDGHYIEKKDGKTTDITDEIPFDIPASWQWVRLGSIITLISGQDFPPSGYNDRQDGIPYITGASNMDNGKLIVNRWTPSPSSIAQQGDLLITCKGTVGEMVIMTIPQAHVARQIMAIRSVREIQSKFIAIVLKGEMNSITGQKNGLIPGISREVMLQLLFPLPPLAEQKRIVEKLETVLSVLETK